mmetsp:Transcript_39573/g.93194  ORF Transcript_39573/g.93194 Transcript_39573/m.93194 type:complete len:867 (-) Transcript_39573:182-2782(-)
MARATAALRLGEELRDSDRPAVASRLVARLQLRPSLPAGPTALPADAIALADDDAKSSLKREARAHMEQARVCLDKEEHGACSIAALAALDYSRQAGATLEAAEALKTIIEAKRRQSFIAGASRPDDALNFAEVELHRLSLEGDSVELACVQMCLADIYALDLRGSTKIRQALELAGSAVTLFKDAAAKAWQGLALLTLAAVQSLLGKSQAVRELANEALELAQGLADGLMEARALHTLATSYLDAEEYATAVGYSERAARIYAQHCKHQEEALEYLSAALWLSAGEQHQRSQAFAQRALALYRQHGETSGTNVALALVLVVEALANRLQGDRALKVAQDAKEWCKTGPVASYVLQVISHAQTRVGSADAALSAADAALTLAQEAMDVRLQIDALCFRARAHMRAECKEEAVSDMVEAMSLAETLADETETAYLQHELARLRLQNVSRRKPDDEALAAVLDSAQSAHGNFKVLDMADEAASALITQAIVRLIEEDHSAARGLAETALESFEEEGWHKGKDVALTLMAECSLRAGNFSEAEASTVQRREVWQAIGNRRAEARALCSLAELAIDQENWEEAEQRATEAKELAKSAQDRAVEAAASILLAQVQIAYLAVQDDISDAEVNMTLNSLRNRTLKAAGEALELATKSGSVLVRCTAMLWRGQALLVSQRHLEATQVAEDAETLATTCGDKGCQCKAMLLAACVAKATDNTSKMKTCAEAASQLAREAEEPQLLQQAQTLLASCAPAQGGGAQAEAAADPGLPQLESSKEVEGSSSAAAPPAPKGLDLVNVTKKVQEIVLELLAGEEDLTVDTPLMEAGIDSLSSVTFVTDLSKAFNQQVPPAAVFDYPSISAMASFIVEESMA